MIRTLIAERTALIRAGLVACLSQEHDIEVVAEVDRGEQVVPNACSLRSDVALIGDDIACCNGFAVIGAVHTAAPSCRTLIMAAKPSPCDLRKAVAAHATGLVLKDSSLQEISEAIRHVAGGGRVLDPDL